MSVILVTSPSTHIVWRVFSSLWLVFSLFFMVSLNSRAHAFKRYPFLGGVSSFLACGGVLVPACSQVWLAPQGHLAGSDPHFLPETSLCLVA